MFRVVQFEQCVDLVVRLLRFCTKWAAELRLKQNRASITQLELKVVTHGRSQTDEAELAVTIDGRAMGHKMSRGHVGFLLSWSERHKTSKNMNEHIMQFVM